MDSQRWYRDEAIIHYDKREDGTAIIVGRQDQLKNLMFKWDDDSVLTHGTQTNRR